MATLVWPIALDNCRVSHRFKAAHKVLRTQMDDGTVKTRLAATKAAKEFSAVMEFSGAQLEAFEGFLEEGARVLPFEWEHPVTGAPATVKFRKTDFDWELLFGAPDPNLSRYRGTIECEIVGGVEA